jgi:hypothetical protein
MPLVTAVDSTKGNPPLATSKPKRLPISDVIKRRKQILFGIFMHVYLKIEGSKFEGNWIRIELIINCSIEVAVWIFAYFGCSKWGIHSVNCAKQ